jgi:pyrroloquinoline quinone (PQQ) biosynthesis protein C
MTTGGACTVDGVSASLNEAVTAKSPPVDQLADAVRDAHALSAAAYEDGEPEAVRQAETLLHTIHVQNGFFPPTGGTASIVWGVLMRDKLAAALRTHLPDGPVSVDDMRSTLEGAVAKADEQDHTFIDEAIARPDLRGLVIYAKNWFGSTHGFAAQLASLSQRCRGEVRQVVLSNLMEEFNGVEHDELRARFIRRIGLDFDPNRAPEDGDVAVECLSLLNYRSGVSTMRSPAFSLGSFYTIEAVFPPVCRRLLTGLRARGFEEDAIETFRLHVETDENHAAEWMEILQSDELTGEDRARVVAGGLAQLDIRHQMFDATRAMLRDGASAAAEA